MLLLISDQIFRISDIKASDICINFAKSFLLRLPLKITSPRSCVSESRSNFHLLLLSLSKYFVTHVDFSALIIKRLNVNHP